MTAQPQEQQKLRKAELIKPPHTIKEKIGTGGLDEKTLTLAQRKVENNNIDFRPIAQEFLVMLKQALADISSGKLAGERGLEAIIYPVMQMKAQGGMFKYPLVTEICDILINFLETVPDTSRHVIDITVGHQMALQSTLKAGIKDSSHPMGKAFCTELRAACSRYYKRHNAA